MGTVWSATAVDSESETAAVWLVLLKEMISRDEERMTGMPTEKARDGTLCLWLLTGRTSASYVVTFSMKSPSAIFSSVQGVQLVQLITFQEMHCFANPLGLLFAFHRFDWVVGEILVNV